MRGLGPRIGLLGQLGGIGITMGIYYGAAYVNVPEPVAKIIAINFFGLSFLLFGVDLLMDFSDRLHSKKKNHSQVILSDRNNPATILKGPHHEDQTT